jgi:CDGSH-type Zn-finger protein
MATDSDKRIVVEKDGPYQVYGDIPLLRKTQVVSEYGEPLTWKREGTIETSGTYELCRCGQSAEMPFCDRSHRYADWDDAETADTGPTAERQVVFPGGTMIIVKRDISVCMESGFCGMRLANIEQMVAQTGDTNVRSQVIAMIERCPSGSYTYTIEDGEPDIEPDLPQQIAIVTEITSDGPITGPYWVTGSIPIERADGKPFETRNRVMLCGCGQSKIKPLCDGTHRRTASGQA